MMGDHPAGQLSAEAQTINKRATSTTKLIRPGVYNLHDKEEEEENGCLCINSSLCKFQSNQILFFFPLFIIFVLNNPTRLK